MGAAREAMAEIRISVAETRIAMAEVRIAMAEVRIAVAGIRIAVAGIRIAMAEVRIAVELFRIATAPVRFGIEFVGNAPALGAGHPVFDLQRDPMAARRLAAARLRAPASPRRKSNDLEACRASSMRHRSID